VTKTRTSLKAGHYKGRRMRIRRLGNQARKIWVSVEEGVGGGEAGAAKLLMASSKVGTGQRK